MVCCASGVFLNRRDANLIKNRSHHLDVIVVFVFVAVLEAFVNKRINRGVGCDLRIYCSSWDIDGAVHF